MLRYPVDVKRIASDKCRALWVDFPDFPRGEGLDEQQALEALIDKTFNVIAEVIAQRRHPKPSPIEGRPTVAFDEPQEILAPHLRHLLSVTPAGAKMITYSWTNDLAYIE